MSNTMPWSNWLVVVGLGIAGFGVVIALFNDTPLFDLVFNRQIERSFWPEAEIPDTARLFRRWVYGAWGATVAGWGVLIAFIAHVPFRAGARWAWHSLAGAIAVWFVLDTGASVYFGVTFNALAVNLPILVAFAIPLALSRKAFHGRETKVFSATE